MRQLAKTTDELIELLQRFPKGTPVFYGTENVIPMISGRVEPMTFHGETLSPHVKICYGEQVLVKPKYFIKNKKES